MNKLYALEDRLAVRHPVLHGLITLALGTAGAALTVLALTWLSLLIR